MALDPQNYWEHLERLEKLVRASELKSGVIFSFHSLIVGLIADRIEMLKPIILDSLGLKILGSVWIVSVVVSVYYCFKCVIPRLGTKKDANVFYFRDASLRFVNAEKFAEEYYDVCDDEEKFSSELGEQIYNESRIITRKFDCVRWSIWFFAGSMGILILMLFYWLIHI